MNVVSQPLDAALHALANPTRREVVERLGRGAATVSELASPFEMALPSFMQHLRILEESGLVRSEKRGRIRTVHLRPASLRPLATWLDDQRGIWEQRLDRLDAYVKTMETHDD